MIKNVNKIKTDYGITKQFFINLNIAAGIIKSCNPPI